VLGAGRRERGCGEHGKEDEGRSGAHHAGQG
jgi:hypothetical protein